MKRVLAAAAIVLVSTGALRALGPKETKTRNLAILIFPGVQIIDYTGPYEVFGHAYVDDAPAFRIYTVAERKDALTTSMGMSVNPTFTLASAPKPDVLVVPGGGVDSATESAEVIAWVQASARDAEVVLSVCNGAFILAKAGLLDGLEATTFAGLIDELKTAAPKTRVVSDKRFVDNGKIVTAAGLSSGIDGALHVIEKLFGRGAAQVAATSLEYDWRPESGYARAMLADRRLAPGYDAVRSFARAVVRHEGDRDRWETSWRVRSTASAAEVLERLDRGFAGDRRWAREPGRASAGTTSSAWRLSAEDGTRWLEATRVEPLPGGEKGYLVSLSVVRAPATAAAR